MELNTRLHQKLWCRFSLHKTQFNLVQAAVEAVVFGYESLRKRAATLFILI